jgi:hypothetical protein
VTAANGNLSPVIDKAIEGVFWRWALNKRYSLTLFFASLGSELKMSDPMNPKVPQR